MSGAVALQRAWRMYQSDSDAETYVAGALVLLVAGPTAYTFIQKWRGS